MEFLKEIPQTPGCYLFKDDKDQIIYVGKSKFLPKRVKSYFIKKGDPKTIKLVSEIKSADFISTESENEALVLEEDLIKLYKPKFNIKGKDDKTIRSKLILTNEEWCKLELVYKNEKIEGDVLAQFTSSKIAKEVYQLLHDIFRIRSCSYVINNESIEKKKLKYCLEYQIGRCSAPCVGLQSKLEELTNKKLIKDIFRFNFNSTHKYFRKLMKFFSEKLEFEKANSIKTKINYLVKLESVMKPLKLRESKLRLDQIKNELKLKFTPLIIDAFDNSHTSGKDAVCGLVRFSNLIPDKTAYRKFIIKSGVGGDDIKSFEEVLSRRLKRLIEENSNLPNLIFIDGGRSQLNIAKKVVHKFNLSEKLDIISISKDEKHRPKLIHLLNGEDLDVKRFIELSIISEEVHRFSISFHRKKMTKNLLNKK